jgi:hypothetical protein
MGAVAATLGVIEQTLYHGVRANREGNWRKSARGL